MAKSSRRLPKNYTGHAGNIRRRCKEKEGATLRGADLRDAYLRRARFDGADLASADLRRTRGLTEAQVRVAVCDAGTRLPDTIGRGGPHGK